MRVTPFGNRFLVKPDDIGDVSKSGIIIANVEKEKPMTGIIERVGNGELISDSGIRVGHHVVFNKYNPDEIEVNGGVMLLVGLEDIMAVIE